ncbi:MAG: hypothetical protein F4X91_08910 [Nitrospinae bacterium]|nr:hypothetical protein [Nitrospinota bacterium]
MANGRLAIRYRAFLLSPEPDHRPARKEAIMGHWEMAKSHPGGEEINPVLMARRDFPYPHSTPGAVAIKAFAAQLPEREGEYLEAVERTHLVECRNIDDADVLVAAAERLGAEPAMMREVMADPDMTKRVWADHIEAVNAGIQSTPTVDFSGQYRITGAQPMEVFQQALERALADAEA